MPPVFYVEDQPNTAPRFRKGVAMDKIFCDTGIKPPAKKYIKALAVPKI